MIQIVPLFAIEETGAKRGQETCRNRQKYEFLDFLVQYAFFPRLYIYKRVLPWR